jgi:hypothetical protein
MPFSAFPENQLNPAMSDIGDIVDIGDIEDMGHIG